MENISLVLNFGASSSTLGEQALREKLQQFLMLNNIEDASIALYVMPKVLVTVEDGVAELHTEGKVDVAKFDFDVTDEDEIKSMALPSSWKNLARNMGIPFIEDASVD